MSDRNHRYFAWGYPAEKFGLAIDSLATGFGPNWERMLSAVMSISHLMPSHFPDRDVYERTRRVIEWASALGPLEINGKNYYGSFENTLRRRRRRSFERYASEILEIASEIAFRRGDYQET